MVKPVSVQNPAGLQSVCKAKVQQPANVSSLNLICRKVAGLAYILIAATRAYPGSIAAVGAAVVAFHRFSGHNFAGRSVFDSSDTASKPVVLIDNLESMSVPGTKVLVIDLPVGYFKDTTHSQDVAYVVNRHMDHSKPSTTFLYKDGVGSDGELICNLADLCTRVSKLKNPPDVVTSAVGQSTVSMLGQLQTELAKFSPSYTGPPPVYPPSALRAEIIRLLDQLPNSFNQEKNILCSNGLGQETHFSQSIQALLDSGVSVVLSSHNGGQLYESLKEFGIDNPERAFDAIGYGRQSSNPPGLIVVGGVGPEKEGHFQIDRTAGPLSTIDVAALSVNIPVNSNGFVSSGVSFATPQVAAIVANIKAINPQLKPAEIEQILKESATPVPGNEARVGAGVVNPTAAYQLASQSRSVLQRIGLN